MNLIAVSFLSIKGKFPRRVLTTFSFDQLFVCCCFDIAEGHQNRTFVHFFFRYCRRLRGAGSRCLVGRVRHRSEKGCPKNKEVCEKGGKWHTRVWPDCWCHTRVWHLLLDSSSTAGGALFTKSRNTWAALPLQWAKPAAGPTGGKCPIRSQDEDRKNVPPALLVNCTAVEPLPRVACGRLSDRLLSSAHTVLLAPSPLSQTQTFCVRTPAA